MSVTEQDRERIWQIVLRHSNNSQTSAEYDAYLEDLAQALADERERERSQWNPMVGRVLAIAQEWHRNGDSHGQQIFDAIEGNAK